jgi:hypothetical protein
MWALKVSRSTTAAASLGSVKVLPHSEKGALEAQAMDPRSSRAVMTWNSSSVPRGSKVEPGVAAEDAGELFAVGSFGELVDRLGAGEVADPSARFGGAGA